MKVFRGMLQALLVCILLLAGLSVAYAEDTVLTITPAGGIITQPTEVSIECNDPDFYVYFQRVNSFSGNGFDPELMPYNGSFTVNPGTKVIAAATRAPFDPESAVDLIETTVTFDPVRVSTPVITPASGIYEGDIIVSISCEEGATIYYYIDDENATEYLYTGPFTVNGCTTVTAWAVKEGIARSEAVTSNYRMPNRPPVAVLGGDRSYEYIGGMTNGAGVEIDATNSYDLDGDTLGYIWDLNVEYAEVEPGKIVLCAPIGLTDVKVTVTDGEYSSTDSITITVADTIAPEISAYYYAQGCDNYWYNNPVHISFGAIDTGTGVKNISPIDAVLLEEGKDQSVICSAEDNAGNTVEKVFSGFNIDLTPPTVIVNIADEYKVGDTLFLDVITEDALSGVLKSEITGVGTGGTVYHPGDQVELTYECTRGIWIMCQDMAGNETRELKVISVYDLNQPPEADDDSAVTDENAPVTIDVLTNDSDLDDDTLTITAVTNGANGIVTTNGTTVTYTPVTGFIGTDSFTYTISDGNGGTAIGTVTVRKIQTSPVLTWSNPTDIVYGTPLGIDQLNASSNVPGIFVYTPALGTILHTGGSQNLHVDFIPNDETSYNCVSLDVRINVIPATLTVKADNKIMKFGDTLPEFTATITGYVNGDDVSVLTGSPSLTLSNTVNGAGNYEIKVSRGSLGSTDYNFTFISGTLTVSSYNFQGFFQPVDMGSKVYNKVKAGSAIPIKFSLDGDQGLDIFLSSNYPGWLTISNPTGISTLDDIEQIVNAVGSSLKYDPSTKQYIYVWKTDKAWAGTSRQFIMIFKDGTKATANFQFVK